MDRVIFNHIEKIVKDYKNYDKYIREREEELLTPIQEPNDNIGGGKSSIVGKPTEYKALKIVDDRYLRQLRRQKEAVEYALKNSDSLTCKVIELYYMSETQKKWDTVAFELYKGQISVRTLKRLRSTFFSKIQTHLGW